MNKLFEDQSREMSPAESLDRAHAGGTCRPRSGQSRIPNPESRIPNPESRIPNPESRITLLSLLALLPLLLTACRTAAAPGDEGAVLQPPVVLADVVLTGDLSDGEAAFTLTATAKVTERRGATLDLMGGKVALTEFTPHEAWRLRTEDGRFKVEFDRRGEFPLALQFRAAVDSKDAWNRLGFDVTPGPLYRVVLRGLPEETEFEFPGAAQPERSGAQFVSFLPVNGQVQLAWKAARDEGEGKLFYAAEALSQITVSQGLLRQTTVMDFKVMQGELNQVEFDLAGPGEITRIQGQSVLAWSVRPAANDATRRVSVRLNQAQKDAFQLAVQIQQPLGAFPLAVDPPQLRPTGATRFAGHFRVVNEGAVRLEVVQADGLSQISPEQFPADETFQALGLRAGSQTFAYRFSGAEFRLRLQADNILPELGVSQVVTYHLGETELAIEAELELDVREAPLRELVLHLPQGYALVRLQASGMSDYFTADGTNQTTVLRMVYGQPVSGRQVVQLRLERNTAFSDETWALPPISVARAKSVRGHLGVSADAGFRLTPSRTEGLTEIATAFFPKQVPGLQQAFRLSDPAWEATVLIERLAQSIQADAFHLFSVSEGIAYGSSVVNYLVSGAPISTLRVELSDEYYNVEFTGREIRNWQRTTNGYVVHLHTPISGSYQLLATYERPFRTQGETLSFSGTRPLDPQTEQGHTLVISDYQFQVNPVNVSSNLLVLEPGEVPSEYRLFFDAPILAAYRYSTRPFNLELALQPLEQGDTLSQVIDRAVLTTQISAEGQVLTDVRYFVKSKGAPWFRITVPSELKLWSATVNGKAAVPVAEDRDTLIPLPGRMDPDTLQVVEVKLAGRAGDPDQLTVGTPKVTAPVLLTEWTLNPDAGHRLLYRPGSLTPVDSPGDLSGYAGLARFFQGGRGLERLSQLVAAALLLGGALLIWRRTAGPTVYRWSPRHMGGAIAGLIAGGFGLVLLLTLAQAARSTAVTESAGLRFLIPVQQAEASTEVTVANVAIEQAWTATALAAWPALLGVLMWLTAWIRWEGGLRQAGFALAWACVAWGWLRLPHGAPGLFIVAATFGLGHVLWPAWRTLNHLPRAPLAEEPPPAAAVVGLLMLGSLLLGGSAQAEEPVPDTPPAVVADSVLQDIGVVNGFAQGEVTVEWMAGKGEVLPLLAEPAVVTALEFSGEQLERVMTTIGERRAVAVRARRDGLFTVRLRYELQVRERQGTVGFVLPTRPGLVQRVTLRLPDLEADILAPSAVSIDRDPAAPANTTVARLVLSPEPDPSIEWRPRSRDTRTEASVFYAEVHQIYVPAAGVLEGLHHVLLRPAQGEIREAICAVPPGFTIADVTAQGLSTWRFDPDAGKLRLTFNPPQSRALAVAVRSQLATGPLPYERDVGVLKVEGASGQIGLLAVATGNEVQLDDAGGSTFTAINLEDFPAAALQPLEAQTAGLAVRRAFRHGDDAGLLSVKAAAVEPDVRLDSQQTLSLGEDRLVLAATLQVAITRAGLFRLSFALPENLDVESISGPAMSHWTILKDPESGQRMVTLHLKGKTEGQQQFDVSLSGPGLRQAQGWALPRLSLHEASKQRGQLVVVPEQGMRLQVSERTGVTQLDPARSGIRQKGVLAFRLLQDPWRVALDVEQVDSWIQVMSLQDVLVGEGQLRITANLQYEIENTGVKNLLLRLPAEADGVRFKGDQVSDYLPAESPEDAGASNRLWEVKLHRRMLGSYQLQVSYQIPLATQADQFSVSGVQATDANLQRGFVGVRAEGRLQLRIDSPPQALQAAEWQSIPRKLLADMPVSAAAHTFRLVEPAFSLPVTVDRREAVRLLPARVNQVLLTSVVSDDGVMLTKARLDLTPGDKRLLSLRLPPSGRFWFAFVNQRGVWPWQGTNGLLIPLEQESTSEEAITVEFFYTLSTTAAQGRALDLALAGPEFDLPLENVVWNLYLNDRWDLKDWEGTLELSVEQPAAVRTMDLQTYMREESSLKQQQIQEAQQLISLANDYLQEGDPQQARRAFQAAYGLSKHDDAFNEDARVQLHNLKMQQALIGLNNRAAVVAGATDAPALQLQAGRGQQPAYTQELAREIIAGNTAEENAVMMKLAERLVQQQEAAVPSPAAIRASVPEGGQRLTFTRALLVDEYAPLSLRIRARAPAEASAGWQMSVLGGAFGLFLILGLAARSDGRKTA